MELSVLSFVGVSPAALLLITFVLVALVGSGCGPSEPPKWTNFRDAPPAPTKDR